MYKSVPVCASVVARRTVPVRRPGSVVAPDLLLETQELQGKRDVVGVEVDVPRPGVRKGPDPTPRPSLVTQG